MEKRGKRGQFYLVSAIIVAVIVISIVLISNYSKKRDYSDLSSLSEEIRIEAANVIDYSINSGDSDAEISNRLEEFSQDYINLESRDKNLYFLFGTDSSMILKGAQEKPHTVSLNGNVVTSGAGEFSGSIVPSTGSINLGIDDDLHFFNVNSGQNFYFVLSKDIDGGNYVVTG